MLEKLEELLQTWYKQIEQVLAESEQIRREADDIGPSAELLYWKSRMAKFNTYVKPLNVINLSLIANNCTAWHTRTPVAPVIKVRNIVL